MSPEALGIKQGEKLDILSKRNVWSLGIVYYQMLSGRTPWIGCSEEELLNNISNKYIAIE